MKEYKKKQIIKHALQNYIQRPNTSAEDLAAEKRLLMEITEDVERMKAKYGIK